MNIIAIVQARMGSTRCPGKVLRLVDNKPLLWYLVNRLKQSAKINGLVIATTTAEGDDKIVEFCKENSVKYYRGSENDVLDRYYQCALQNKADVIVRITADCPLLDPGLTDSVIEGYLKDTSFDLIHTGPSYPEGLDTEVMPAASLITAWKEARLASEREHVTAFIWKNKDRFKIKTLSLDNDYSFLRLTVDEELDFEVVSEALPMLMKRKGMSFSLKDILELYNERPDLFKKNSKIIRNEGYLKSIEKDSLAYD